VIATLKIAMVFGVSESFTTMLIRTSVETQHTCEVAMGQGYCVDE
jgi:hypothetical protein